MLQNATVDRRDANNAGAGRQAGRQAGNHRAALDDARQRTRRIHGVRGGSERMQRRRSSGAAGASSNEIGLRLRRLDGLEKESINHSSA
jgi:hypothetical protein